MPEIDGFPPPPADAGYDDLRRYAGIRTLACYLQAMEREDNRVLYGLLSTPPAPAAPTELWEKATRYYDQEMAAKAARDLDDAALAEAAAADPSFARAVANFEAARESCRTGHPDGCTFGGLTPATGYWLATDTCDLEHGETCQLRLACDGAEATATFSDWANGWIWRVFSCSPCAETWRAAQPQWAALKNGKGSEQ